jgi:hypothetical protein
MDVEGSLPSSQERAIGRIPCTTLSQMNAIQISVIFVHDPF